MQGSTACPFRPSDSRDSWRSWLGHPHLTVGGGNSVRHYFSELADAQPGEALPLTLAGFFQARLGEDVDAALAKLDQAAATDLGPLYRLMEQYQQFDPFKFLIYAELAGAEIGPAE